MKKLNSLIYLFYYVLLWVVLPSTGLGARVFAKELSHKNYHSITNRGASFSDFQHCVNPDWNRVVSREADKNWLSETGHWPVLFSAVFKPQLIFLKDYLGSQVFSNAPVIGAFTATKIIFPFHYFW